MIAKRDKLVAVPGTGLNVLPLRASEEEIIPLFGNPDAVKQFEDEKWLSFLQLGIDFGVHSKQKCVIAINLFRRGVRGHKEAQCQLSNGLRVGVLRNEVEQIMGKPLASHKPWTDVAGGQHRPWLDYPGVAFEFGIDERVDVIIIFGKGS